MLRRRLQQGAVLAKVLGCAVVILLCLNALFLHPLLSVPLVSALTPLSVRDSTDGMRVGYEVSSDQIICDFEVCTAVVTLPNGLGDMELKVQRPVIVYTEQALMAEMPSWSMQATAEVTMVEAYTDEAYRPPTNNFVSRAFNPLRPPDADSVIKDLEANSQGLNNDPTGEIAESQALRIEESGPVAQPSVDKLDYQNSTAAQALRIQQMINQHRRSPLPQSHLPNALSDPEVLDFMAAWPALRQMVRDDALDKAAAHGLSPLQMFGSPDLTASSDDWTFNFLSAENRIEIQDACTNFVGEWTDLRREVYMQQNAFDAQEHGVTNLTADDIKIKPGQQTQLAEDAAAQFGSCMLKVISGVTKKCVGLPDCTQNEIIGATLQVQLSLQSIYQVELLTLRQLFSTSNDYLKAQVGFQQEYEDASRLLLQQSNASEAAGEALLTALRQVAVVFADFDQAISDASDVYESYLTTQIETVATNSKAAQNLAEAVLNLQDLLAGYNEVLGSMVESMAIINQRNEIYGLAVLQQATTAAASADQMLRIINDLYTNRQGRSALTASLMTVMQQSYVDGWVPLQLSWTQAPVNMQDPGNPALRRRLPIRAGTQTYVRYWPVNSSLPPYQPPGNASAPVVLARLRRTELTLICDLGAFAYSDLDVNNPLQVAALLGPVGCDTGTSGASNQTADGPWPDVDGLNQSLCVCWLARTDRDLDLYPDGDPAYDPMTMAGAPHDATVREFAGVHLAQTAPITWRVVNESNLRLPGPSVYSYPLWFAADIQGWRALEQGPNGTGPVSNPAAPGHLIIHANSSSVNYTAPEEPTPGIITGIVNVDGFLTDQFCPQDPTPEEPEQGDPWGANWWTEIVCPLVGSPDGYGGTERADVWILQMMAAGLQDLVAAELGNALAYMCVPPDLNDPVYGPLIDTPGVWTAAAMDIAASRVVLPNGPSQFPAGWPSLLTHWDNNFATGLPGGNGTSEAPPFLGFVRLWSLSNGGSINTVVTPAAEEILVGPLPPLNYSQGDHFDNATGQIVSPNATAQARLICPVNAALFRMWSSSTTGNALGLMLTGNGVDIKDPPFNSSGLGQGPSVLLVQTVRAQALLWRNILSLMPDMVQRAQRMSEQAMGSLGSPVAETSLRGRRDAYWGFLGARGQLALNSTPGLFESAVPTSEPDDNTPQITNTQLLATTIMTSPDATPWFELRQRTTRFNVWVPAPPNTSLPVQNGSFSPFDPSQPRIQNVRFLDPTSILLKATTNYVGYPACADTKCWAKVTDIDYSSGAVRTGRSIVNRSAASVARDNALMADLDSATFYDNAFQGADQDEGIFPYVYDIPYNMLSRSGSWLGRANTPSYIRWLPPRGPAGDRAPLGIEGLARSFQDRVLPPTSANLSANASDFRPAPIPTPAFDRVQASLWGPFLRLPIPSAQTILSGSQGIFNPLDAGVSLGEFMAQLVLPEQNVDYVDPVPPVPSQQRKISRLNRLCKTEKTAQPGGMCRILDHYIMEWVYAAPVDPATDLVGGYVTEQVGGENSTDSFYSAYGAVPGVSRSGRIIPGSNNNNAEVRFYPKKWSLPFELVLPNTTLFPGDLPPPPSPEVSERTTARQTLCPDQLELISYGAGSTEAALRFTYLTRPVPSVDCQLTACADTIRVNVNGSRRYQTYEEPGCDLGPAPIDEAEIWFDCSPNDVPGTAEERVLCYRGIVPRDSRAFLDQTRSNVRLIRTQVQSTMRNRIIMMDKVLSMSQFDWAAQEAAVRESVNRSNWAGNTGQEEWFAYWADLRIQASEIGVELEEFADQFNESWFNESERFAQERAEYEAERAQQTADYNAILDVIEQTLEVYRSLLGSFGQAIDVYSDATSALDAGTQGFEANIWLYTALPPGQDRRGASDSLAWSVKGICTADLTIVGVQPPDTPNCYQFLFGLCNNALGSALAGILAGTVVGVISLAILVKACKLGDISHLPDVQKSMKIVFGVTGAVAGAGTVIWIVMAIVAKRP